MIIVNTAWGFVPGWFRLETVNTINALKAVATRQKLISKHIKTHDTS